MIPLPFKRTKNLARFKSTYLKFRITYLFEKSQILKQTIAIPFNMI